MPGLSSARNPTALLVRLHARRLRNLIAGRPRRFGGAASAPRSPGRRSEAIVLPLITAIGLLLASRFVMRAARAVASRAGRGAVRRPDLRTVAATFVLGLSAHLAAAGLSAGWAGARGLGRKDAELDWLSALPVRPAALLLARLALRTCANLPSVPPLLAFGFALASVGSPGPQALLRALPVALVLVVAVTAVELALESALRPRLRPSSAGNLQGICAVLSTLALFLACAPAFFDQVPLAGVAGSPLLRLPTLPAIAVAVLTADTLPAWRLAAPPGSGGRASAGRGPRGRCLPWCVGRSAALRTRASRRPPAHLAPLAVQPAAPGGAARPCVAGQGSTTAHPGRGDAPAAPGDGARSGFARDRSIPGLAADPGRGRLRRSRTVAADHRTERDGRRGALALVAA